MMQENLVIHKMFSWAAQTCAGKVALQIKADSGWQRYTYAEVEASAGKIAVFLIEQGYKKGDCAAVVLGNCPEWAIIYLGIIYAGLVCVAVDPESGSRDLNNIFEDCHPVVAFVSEDVFQERIKHITYDKLRIMVVDSGDFKRIQSQPAQDIRWPDVASSDVASLIYTSGTTAKPKGVMLTHYNFCSNFRSIEKLNFCSPGDNFLSILPLYHTYSFMVTLLVPLLIGARITYAKSFKPEDLTGIIKQADITILTGVPQLFSLIHRTIFARIKMAPSFLRPVLVQVAKRRVRREFGRSLRLLVSGGARLDPKVGRDLSGLGLRVIEGYGLTETSPVVTMNPLKKPRFGSVGKAIPDVEIRIDNPNNSGTGEVFIRGPNVMLGYFKQPDLTARVISAQGWFNSRDLGYLDKQGYLLLTGRKKDVIVLSSGKNIFPEELEEYYNQSSYIKEICVFQKAQQQFGRSVELLFAVIVPDFECFRRSRKVNIYERVRWELENLSCGLPAYKRIKGFIVVKEDLPRTRLKKIKRFEVVRQYSGRPLEALFLPGQEGVKDLKPSPEDKGILSSGITQKIIKYLSSQLNKKVDLNSHLELDLGIDSLGRVELGTGLESLLSIGIPQGCIDNILTVRELVVSIQRIAEGDEGKSGSRKPQKQKTWGEILNEAPPEEVLNKIRLRCSFFNKTLTRVLKSFFTFMFRTFWFLETKGRDSIPDNGPYIFCPNHASYLDGFALLASVPFGCAVNLFFIGHAKIFEHPLVSWIVKAARLISIEPATHLTRALQAARFVLEHKKIICIFPEGSRSIDSNIQEFKKGVGILARELNIVLIPVYIKGSHFTWPRTKRFPRIHPVKVIFGKPVPWQELGNDYASITKGLRQEVMKLKMAEGGIKLDK